MTPIAYSQTAGMSSARSVRLLSSDAVRRCSRPGWAKRLQSWQGVPRAAATDSQVQVERAVKFSIQQRVEFGESMRLVGGSDQFGAWNPDGAPLLQWGEDHVWTWDGTLPLGEYEFKVVITRQEGEPSWEDGDNRKLVVVAGDAAIDVNMSWGNVAEMVVTETEVEVPAVEKEVAGENGSSKDGVNGSSAASTEAGAGSTGGSIVPDTIPAALVESVLERELSNTLNGSVETTGTADRASSGAGDAFVRAASALDLESDTSSPPNGSRSVLLATAMASSTKQAAVGSTAATKNSADGYGWEGADPSAAALDALMSAVAFAAVPVVGWSLYTLHSTGCGLPPGPDGLLGAAEGVSYLGVTAMAGYGLYKRATGGASAGVVVAAELLSYSTIAIGLAVLAVQVQSYGYIPSALPDVNCFGDGSPTSTLPPLSLPDIKLPAVDLKPLQDSFKQVGSTLDAVKSQLPSVAAQLSKQLSSQAAALTSKLPSQEFLASQVNQGVAQAQTLGAQLGAQVGSGLSKAQEVGAQLSTQAGTASSQLIVKLDSSFQAVPGQLQQLSAGLNQLSSKLPPLPPQ